MVKDSTFKSINLYQQQLVFWDRKHVDYRNREKRLLSEIGLKYECTAEEMQRKIHNLRNRVKSILKQTALIKQIILTIFVTSK